MPKAVLLSIKPKYCEFIANGKKTIEVRKTRPRLKPPFKCYIYCTQGDKLWVTTERKRFFCNGKVASIINAKDVGGCYLGNSKVIGEFVCDRIDTYDDNTISAFSSENYVSWNDFDLNRACIHPQDFEDYANGKWLYGWHISDLVIYDMPKELGRFWKAGKCPIVAAENGCAYEYYCFRLGQTNICGETLTWPPQSWCYVEEVQNNERL